MCHQSLPCEARPGDRAGHARNGRNLGWHAAETALKSVLTGTPIRLTLRDLVSYDTKHNEGNGESNRSRR